jgi:hypothetical protein
MILDPRKKLEKNFKQENYWFVLEPTDATVTNDTGHYVHLCNVFYYFTDLIYLIFDTIVSTTYHIVPSA